MFGKLVALLNEYLIIGTTVGPENHYYRCKLVDISPEYYEIELYTQDGHCEGRVMGPLMAITSVQMGNRELQELALHVSMNQSRLHEELCY